MRKWKALTLRRPERLWCSSMYIGSFDDLLCAAREQPEPQRLLFVFAGAGLPEDSTLEQRARFEAGEGGTLEPLMSVDMDPQKLHSFDSLVEEACEFGRDWAVVFVAGLSGRDGRAPTSSEADRYLERMIALIRSGVIDSFIPFDRQGRPLLLE
jgi:hypothetical protein